MTLAIAIAKNSQVALMSDSSLSYDVNINPAPNEFRPGAALKIFFIRRHLALSYAGTSEVAHKLAQAARAMANKSVPTSEIAQFLHSKTSPEMDFLLADCLGNGSIHKIISEACSSTLDGIYWIGNADAANHVLLDLRPSEFVLGTAIHLEQRFQNANNEKRFPGVGGIVVSAIGTQDGVKFIGKMNLASYYNRLEENNEWQTVEWGGAAQGGYGYTTIVPCAKGENGWGVHFFQGRCGYFFHVDLDIGVFEILRWSDANLQTAMNSLEANLALPLECCGARTN